MLILHDLLHAPPATLGFVRVRSQVRFWHLLLILNNFSGSFWHFAAIGGGPPGVAQWLPNTAFALSRE
jgi:hypothetical protein